MQSRTESAATKRATAHGLSRYWFLGVLLGILLIAGIVMSLILVERWVRAQGAQPRFPGSATAQPQTGGRLPEVIIERSQPEEEQKDGPAKGRKSK